MTGAELLKMRDYLSRACAQYDDAIHVMVAKRKAGKTFSLEDHIAGHGYLTKALLDLVNSSNFRITYTRLIEELVNRVSQLSGNIQHPTLRGQQARMENIFLEGWNTSV